MPNTVRTRKFSSMVMCVLMVGSASIASARGHKPDYQDRTVYVPPARRGSAANPNSAFSPPRFSNDPFAKPAAVPATGAAATPPTYNYGYDKPAASTHATSSKTKSATPTAAAPLPSVATPAATVVPSNADGLQAPDNHPTSPPAVTPAQAGVPELPGFDAPTGNAAPAANPDGLQAPSSSDIHPNAK